MLRSIRGFHTRGVLNSFERKMPTSLLLRRTCWRSRLPGLGDQEASLRCLQHALSLVSTSDEHHERHEHHDEHHERHEHDDNARTTTAPRRDPQSPRATDARAAAAAAAHCTLSVGRAVFGACPQCKPGVAHF